MPSIDREIDAAVVLPADMSPDGHELWDWAARMSAAIQRQDEIRRLRKEIAEAKRCGACALWMHSGECPREHNVQGYNRGPSMSALPCRLFVWNQTYKNLLEQREEELANLLALSLLPKEGE